MRRLLAFCLALGGPAAVLAADGADEAAVRRLNADYVQAYLTCDVARFRELLADDFTCVLADGRTVDRAHFLAMAALPPPVAGFRNDEVVVRIYGDSAVVHGRAAYRRPDHGVTITRYVEVYVRLAGRWRMISDQFTRSAQ